MNFSNCSEENLLYQPKYFTEWRSEVLYGLAKWKNGLAFKKINFSNNGKPVIKIAELKNGLSAQTKYTRDEFDKSVFLTKGDMVFSWSGNPETSIDIFWYSLPDGWLNQHIFKVTVDNGIDEKFFYYILKFLKPNFTAIASNKQTTGLGHVTIGDLKNIIVKLPELEEQKAIAHILSTLDDKIEVNNQINKTLENMAQAIFKQWFVDFEFPNEDGEPYKSSGGEMIESELGRIPVGWEVGNLAESKLTNLVKTGIAEFSGEKIYLATADVDKSNILSNTTKVTYNERPSRANMRPRENTVWFAKMKDSRKLIRVSKKSKELIDNYIFSTGFAGINVKEGLNYIWSFICSEDFDTRKNNLCNGTTMQAINNSNISNIPLLLPNEEILKKYEDITDYLFESEYLRKKENEKLAEIRDTLLPKLMSGEIRVPLDEEGEAS